MAAGMTSAEYLRYFQPANRPRHRQREKEKGTDCCSWTERKKRKEKQQQKKKRKTSSHVDNSSNVRPQALVSKQTAGSPLSSLVTAGWSTVIKCVGDGPKKESEILKREADTERERGG